MGETIELDIGNIVLEPEAVIDQNHSEDNLERALLNAYGAETVHTALTELGFSGRDQYVVLAYFGVREEPKNLRQISHRLGLSSERVRQIKQVVLDKLRVRLESLEINDSEDVFTA